MIVQIDYRKLQRICSHNHYICELLDETECGSDNCPLIEREWDTREYAKAHPKWLKKVFEYARATEDDLK